MSARFTFHFDSAACSGCKACAVACRDRHALPAGVSWRRVYEVAGGGWRREGEGWLHDVFAYHLSVACHHCARPICTEVCPTGAMRAGGDGIVLVDEARCIGCRYCAWACPYGAPQFDTAAGVVSKCTLCSEDLAAGRDPACVAACPLRVLHLRRGGDGAPGWVEAGIFPLVAPELTQPALRIRPHARAAGAAASGRVANREEVRTAPAPRAAEASLVAFTLGAQLAAGIVLAALGHQLIAGVGPSLAASVGAAAFVTVAAAASLLHLGRRRHAWRALGNLRRSWLSREIAATLAFAAGCWALAGARLAGAPVTPVVTGSLAAAGLATVFCMARVYRLRTAPAWRAGRTAAAFFLTALVPGTLAGSALIVAGGGAPGRALLLALPAVTLLVLAAADRTAFYARVAERPL